MNCNWYLLLYGWLGGIPFTLLADWLFHKWLNWRKKRKGEYITTTRTDNGIDFEGHLYQNSKLPLTGFISAVTDIDYVAPQNEERDNNLTNQNELH